MLVTDPYLTVIVDGTACIDHDISGNFAFEGYVGFTAGTGSLTHRHLIHSLEVTELIREE